MLSRNLFRLLVRGAHQTKSIVSVSYIASRKLHKSVCLQKSAQVELTAVRYPEVKRGNYSELTDKHIKFFESILGKDRTLTDSADVEAYNVDWIKMVRGQSRVVLKPKTTEEVSAILKFCNDETLAVCPQGGNTGLVGGSVPVFDEVIISTSLMNQIISLDELSGVLTCQAGCVLEALETYLSEHGFVMPLDLGAKGSCHIGGNVSTNAGGIRLLRYGSLHGSVLGVEAVKANGEVIDCLSSLKKDNTGYHLKHLFIGSEGTLGIVTKVTIHCPPSPKAVNVAFLGLNSFDDVLKTSISARRKLGEVLSSCEMMDHVTLDAVTSNLNLRNPIGEHPFYMLLETSGSNGEHDEAKLNAFLESSMSSGEVLDGTVANEPSRIQSIWEVRERVAEGLLADGCFLAYDISLPLKNFYDIVPIMAKRLVGTSVKRCCGVGHIGKGLPFKHYGRMSHKESQIECYYLWQLRERVAEGLVHDGYVFKYDISLPLKEFYTIVPKMAERLAGNKKFLRCCGYGHIGDGNLHLNITSKEFDHDLHDLIEPFVFEWTSKLKGSVSAEHGIGFKKTKFIHYSKSDSSLNMMQDIKKLLDPKGILNPYKVLPK